MDIPAGTVVTLVSRSDDCPMAAVKVRPGLWELHPVSNAGAHAVQLGSSSLKPVFPECIFVVLRKGPFYGFSSVCAEGRNLQAVKTEGTPHRCANYNFNTWETWEAVLKEASPSGSENREVIFRNRAWAHKVLDVDVKQLRSFLSSDIIHLDVSLRRDVEAKQILEDKLREANAVLGEMEAALSREAAKVQSERSELGYKVEQLQVGASKLEGILNEKMSLVRSMEEGMQRLRDAEREAAKSASALRVRVQQLTEEGQAKEEALLTLERERFRLAAALEMLAREVQNSKGMEQATQSRNNKPAGQSSSSGTHELSVGSAGSTGLSRPNNSTMDGSSNASQSNMLPCQDPHPSISAKVSESLLSATAMNALPAKQETISATKPLGASAATNASHRHSLASGGGHADADAPPSSSRRVLGERSTNTLTPSSAGTDGSALKVRVRRTSASSTTSSHGVGGYGHGGDGHENNASVTVTQEKADRTMTWLQKVAPTHSAHYSQQASPAPDMVLATLSASRSGAASDRRHGDISGTVAPPSLRYGGEQAPARRPASVAGDASVNASSRPAGRSLEDICLECWEPRVACLCASNAILV